MKYRFFASIAAIVFLFTACGQKNTESVQTAADADDPAIVGAAVTLTGKVEKITLGSESVTITKAGNYNVTGTLKNGALIVDAPKADVHIMLSGADITNETGSALFVQDAAKCDIILASGTVNKLSDGAEYKKEEQKAALFSKSPLIIRGDGSLEVTANYKHAIASNDTLVIQGGKITVVSAVTDGLHSNEDTQISKGIFQIKADSDGIQSEKKLHVEGGQIEVDAGDDGVCADDTLNISGGTINIKNAYEGLEGKINVNITGGTIQINCEDDAINAGEAINIYAGTINATCKDDGIDSNGNLIINGGSVTVFAQSAANGPLDFGDEAGSTFEINGGTILASGGTMPPRLSATSKQPTLYIYTQSENDQVLQIKDDSGKIIVEQKIVQSSGLIMFSSSELAQGTTYTASIADTEIGTVKLEGISADIGEATGGFGGMGGGRRERGEMPDGMTFPEGFPDGDMTMPDGMTFPEGMPFPEGGGMPDRGNRQRENQTTTQPAQ
ncbi:MAG: carbohydrate-binding domain-containing protein [Oscillospiraceae bacterium]|jgi:lipopolysaccharide export system protein LptC|nr:carbohydrate-binding domain-containing protein [Oscillospiraceae bacterium]